MQPQRFILRLMASVAVAMSSAPAQADLTAEYARSDEYGRLVIEIADNGDLRVTSEQDGGYLLIVGGKAFSIEPGPGGPLVTAAEVLAYNTRQARQAGEIVSFSSENDEHPEFMRFVPGREIELAGYRGSEYLPERGSHTPIGIAHDPALAPLGQAYLRYGRLVEEINAETEVVPNNLSELLAGHGVLRFWELDLQSVSFEQIDPQRFVLPAEPLLLEEVLREGPAERVVDADIERGPSIIGAIYLEGSLWTLTDEGQLLRWAEGEETGAPVDTPGEVTALCKLSDELLIVTGVLEGVGTSRLWSGEPGRWKQEASVRGTEDNPFLSLDCTGQEPLLLTARALLLPRSDRAMEIDPEKLAPGGFFTTLQHGEFLYVGANAGEWGGGLRRFSLTGGAGETFDASDPQDLCGGPLNLRCDPVTGLTPDPKRPDCVLASVGLVHFYANGQVARICDGEVELAYRKPYTLNPDWETRPTADDLRSSSSVPFFSMAASNGVSWAVASDGLYRFAVEERPDFIPFGRNKRWPSSGVDWSDPRFVLVLTDMNQRHSLSGRSLLLVPR